MAQKKKGFLTIAILLVAAIALFFLYRAFAPRAQAGRKHIEITIVHADGSEKTHTLDTGAAYLREALSEVAEIDGEESAQFGYTLYTVDGETADFSRDSSYWAIFVGDNYGTFSLDKQPLEDGGRYSVVYTKY